MGIMIVWGIHSVKKHTGAENIACSLEFLWFSIQRGLGLILTTTYTGDDGTGEVETKRTCVQCHPQLPSEFRYSLGYKRLGVKISKQTYEIEALIYVTLDALVSK